MPHETSWQKPWKVPWGTGKPMSRSHETPGERRPLLRCPRGQRGKSPRGTRNPPRFSRGSVRKLCYNQHAMKFITSKPDVMGGVPVIKGTRVPLEVILYRLKEGYPIEAIHDFYPWVERKTL